MTLLSQESRFQSNKVPLEEVHDITRTLVRVANSTDAKDWTTLRQQFADVIEVDLGERGPRQTMFADELVNWIAAAYSGMETFHMVSNHDVSIEPGVDVATAGKAEDTAHVISYGHVLHRQIANSETMHIDCRYEHQLARGEDGWKVIQFTTIPFSSKSNGRKVEQDEGKWGARAFRS